MTHLVALPALNVLGGARLGALFGDMTLLLTVLASIRIHTLLGAVASTMAFFVAVNALENGLSGLPRNCFLLAML